MLVASATVMSAWVETHADVVSVAIANAVSIRQAHDVITWASKFETIADQGVPADTVITLYIAQSSQTAALPRARKLALKSLLRPECRLALKV